MSRSHTTLIDLFWSLVSATIIVGSVWIATIGLRVEETGDYDESRYALASPAQEVAR
ncbi:MAG: hypothetical protein KC561_01265 [Myxococcales bacterium]|nr:hypothetical protein [Myxococcales bacterium]